MRPICLVCVGLSVCLPSCLSMKACPDKKPSCLSMFLVFAFVCVLNFCGFCTVNGTSSPVHRVHRDYNLCVDSSAFRQTQPWLFVECSVSAENVETCCSRLDKTSRLRATGFRYSWMLVRRKICKAILSLSKILKRISWTSVMAFMTSRLMVVTHGLLQARSCL